MTFYLGIDGGGSKTTCAVGDDSSLLATATAGPSNITRVGKDRARESLQEAIRQACAMARIDLRQVRRACIGVAGAGREEIADTVREIVAEIIPGKIEIVGDMAIAVEAAFAAGPGVIVIAGTGSIAYGRNSHGQTARAGGWGFAISDEGSAHWIGRSAVISLLRAIDLTIQEKQKAENAAEASRLFREMKTAWDLASLDELLRSANAAPDFAMLFPAVLAAAGAGDEIARRVLAQAGAELAQLVAIVVRKIFAPESTKTSIPVAMVGGVFKHSPQVREILREELRKVDLRIEVNPQVVDPVLGALQIARASAKV